MSSDTTEETEIPHFAYLVLRVVPPYPTEISILCHHAETNDIFLPGGRVKPSPFTKMNKTEIFLVETLVLQLGFRLPSDHLSTMHLYWEQTVTENYYEVKYSLYVADVSFHNFINSFRNVGGAQALVSNITFQEELFKLEQSGKPLPNRIRNFKVPEIVRCQYANREVRVHDYENREPKTSCFDYGLLTHISEIKNNLGIDTGIIPKILGHNMRMHEDRHQLWAHALAIYGSDKVSCRLRASRLRPGMPTLSGTPVINVSAYIQKLPNINGEDIAALDAHLAQAPMRLTAMGVDPETKQASLILMSSFIGKLGHWAQQNTEALYSLTSVTQLVDLVRSSFVIKDYQAENLNLLVKLEQGNSDVPDYTRKFNDYYSFWKPEVSEKFGTYLYIMGLRSGPLRADLMSAYSLGKFNSLSDLQLHAARSNLCRLPNTSRVDSQRKLSPQGSKPSGSGKSSWKKQKYLEGGRLERFDKSHNPSVGASGNEGHGYGNSSQGQKRKLPPHEQKKKDSWIKAKQKLSPAEFQQRIKTGSCINCGEQGHIFEACTKPKPS
jgi:hypothetical protein